MQVMGLVVGQWLAVQMRMVQMTAEEWQWRLGKGH